MNPNVRARCSLWALSILLAAACGRAPEPGADRPVVGGRLVAAVLSEPATYNPLLATDEASRAVADRLHAELLTIDGGSGEVVAAAAERWQVSSDGSEFTLHLRPGLRFSDGDDCTANDVLFTFEVVLDPATGAPHRDQLIVDGSPPVVRALDPHTVVVTLAGPYASAARLFDGLAVLPRHLLEPAYRDGRLAAEWGGGVDPGSVAGLGPFRLRDIVPGERIVLERNPYYWRTDADGRRLPLLDELVFAVVPSRDAEVLRLRAGDIDVADRIDPDSFLALTAQAADRLQLVDAGPELGFTFLFFNLNDSYAAASPAMAAAFRDDAFRRATSAAIHRDDLVQLVYRGFATPLGTHVSSSYGAWAHPSIRPPRASADEARRLLAEAGYGWDDEGRLLTPAGAPIELTLLTAAGSTERTRIATIVQDDLSKVGIGCTPVELEFQAFLDRLLTQRDYDACLLALGGGDADPNPMLNVLRSDGSHHLWALERSATPRWQLEIDRLMTRQLTLLDGDARRGAFFTVQELIAEHLPFVPLLSPHVLVGADRRLGGFRPSLLDHHTLWNCDELHWKSAER